MKRISLRIVLLSAVVMIVVMPSVHAGTAPLADPVPLAYGVPTSYKVTIKNCQISSDGGVTWITLWSTGILMDVAAVAKGVEAIKFVQNAEVPTATYNRMRYTVDKTIKITGSVTFGASTYYTSTNAAIDPTSGPAVEFSMDIAGGDQTYTTSGTFKVLPPSQSYLRISFNVDQGLALYASFGGNKIYPNVVVPTLSITAPTVR